MAQTSLRIEGDVKKNAEQACAEIGMFLSTAINIYFKKLGREKCIPFEVSVDPFYFPENMDRHRKSVAQMGATGGTAYEVKLDDSVIVDVVWKDFEYWMKQDKNTLKRILQLLKNIA